jgi:hypothetical protein
MKGKKFALLTAFGSIMAAAPTFAQPYIFPNNDQSAEQQAIDRGACEAWARKETGFDPMNASSPPPSSSADKGVGAVGGAARGALGGAAIGAIAGDAGKGAAIGAIGGGLFGGMKRKDQQKKADAERSHYAAQQSNARSHYMRAFSACMEGKDYTIK